MINIATIDDNKREQCQFIEHAIRSLRCGQIHVIHISARYTHSLTLGQMMRPYGPSFLPNGIFFSCSRENMTMGRVNTRVLPDPVNAIPIISLPDSL